jgi:hypothetical protein
VPAGVFVEGKSLNIPCVEGDDVYVEGWLNSDSALVNMGVHIGFYDVNGVFLGQAISRVVNTTVWRKVALFGTAPTGTKFCNVHVAGSNTDTIDHSIYADDFQVKFATKYIEFVVE